MDVTIAAIKFNHDPQSATNDAITIRKNEKCDIEVPEWQSNDKGEIKISAVAYARSLRSNLTIQVQLRRLNPAVRRVLVSTKAKGLLGSSVKPTEVVFERSDLSNFAMVELERTTLSSAVVRRSEIELEWTFVAELNASQQRSDSQTTKHVIYTLLGPPNAPWAPDEQSSDFEHPWTDVLDLACCWADGAKDTIEAATRITKGLHDLAPEKLTYVLAKADSSLSVLGTDRFKCTMFLNHLASANYPLRIDCTDCAILVSSFSNILGCDLYQSQMGSKKSFGTNPIRVIGDGSNIPFPFDYHEVAWEYPCDHTARLFDCCLQVDGDSSPAGGDFVPLLPVNIRFGNSTSGEYHFRLVRTGEQCEARPGSKKRRRIVRQKFRVNGIHRDLEGMLKDRFAYSSWKDVPSPDLPFSGPVESISEEFSPEGWQLDQMIVLNGEVDQMSLTDTNWRSTASDDLKLRVLTYKCSSVVAARDFLLILLAGFQSPIVRRFDSEKNPEGVAIGELAFSVPDELVMVFARSNLVVFIQNAGKLTPTVTTFALDNDARIQRMLRGEEGFQGTQQTTDLIRTLKKEKNKMLTTDIPNSRWSSNRPRAEEPPRSPNDIKPDGVFEFDTFDPLTGAVTGDYYDVDRHETKPFQGSIKFNGNDSHVFVLSHVVPGFPHLKRLYEGQTAADDGAVVVVAGRWQHLRISVNISEEVERSEQAVFNGQNEGVWVATKP